MSDGSEIEYAIIPPGKWEDDTIEIHPVFHFDFCEIDFDSMDKCEDLIKEAVMSKRPFMPMLVGVIEQLSMKRLTYALMMILEAKKPRTMTHQFVCAAGLQLEDGKSAEEIALSYGISKQAFQQGVQRIKKKLGLRQTRTERSDAAKEKMRLCNYRKQ